ncbi:MAG: DUF885 domain-containing protein, partial [Shewanella sp.]|nr:DUF885 domain-containing protein [Shewanella sp.]
MKKLITLTLLSVAIGGCSISIHAPHSAFVDEEQALTSKIQSPSPLQTYIDQDWQIKLAASAELSASMGDNTQAGKLDDRSPKHLANIHQQRLDLLNQLKALDVSSLSKDEKINKQILQYQLQN